MKAIEFARFGAQVVSLISVAFAYGFAVPAFAQGLPVDWSHRHVIYSNPDTREEAEAKGALDEWIKRSGDPRFVLQLERKERALAAKAERAAAENAPASKKFAAAANSASAKPDKPDKPVKPPKGGDTTGTSNEDIHRDWSNVMGGASGVGAPLVYPAKFAFGVSAKNCASDFVVFVTSSEAADSSGTVLTSVASFSGVPLPGEVFEIHNKRFVPDQVLTLTAHASSNIGLSFAVGANPTQAGINLANAIARNGGTVGVTATAAVGDVTITSITTDVAGPDINFPNTLSNFRLARDDRGRGTPGQPTIFALNQLYADTVSNGGCQTPTQAVPATYWSYNTSGTTYAGAASTNDFGPSGTTRYGPLSGACTALASSTRVVPTDPPAPCDTITTGGIVRGFSVLTSKPPPNTTVTLTVMKNGAPTSITCSFTNFFSCIDNTHQEIFADGDVISVRIVRTGTSTAVWNTNVALALKPPAFVAQTSPVLSLGGDQVAFVQHTTGGVVGTDVASLVLLKWTANNPGTVGVPTRPNTVSAATYRSGCILPCMVVIPFSGGASDTNSSPYVDYQGDILYVGDDSGKLHKFTGVFNGTPAEVVIGGFPAEVSAGNVLSSPVYDSATGLVFVGSGGEAVVNVNGNRLHSVSVLDGFVRNSVGMGTSTLRTGVRDAPILDSAAKRVYAFIGVDGATTDSLGLSCAPAPTCATVNQLKTDVRLGDQDPAKVIVGASSDATNDTNHYIYSGQFDDTYWSSADPANPSGYLYVCGSLLEVDQHPSLWKIQIANNTFVDRTRGPQLVAENLIGTPNGCSPITIVKNGSTDRLFVGVSENAGAFGGAACASGSCVYSYELPFATASSVLSLSSTIPDNAARYMSISVPNTLSLIEADRESLVEPVNEGTFNGMIITQSRKSAAGTTFTYTLRKNGSNTIVTCAIPANQDTCTDATHSIANVAGERIDLQVQRTAGAGTVTPITIRVQLGSAAAAALDAPGGTGGIIIDNTVTGGGSQIYYSTRATGAVGTPKGVAVQASQAGLN